MQTPARRAFEQAIHDVEQARLTRARALNLSPRRVVCADGAVHPGNAVYRRLTELPPGLSGLKRLERLDLAGTGLADLGPVMALARLDCLHFDATPATAADAELARIAGIVDDAARTRAALARIAELARAGEPALPDPVPAPAGAVFVGERLVAAPPPKRRAMDAAAEARARGAWTALRGYHDELAAVFSGRNLPSLERALAAFGTALGSAYETMNIYALGTHGRRIARIAARADQMLLDDSAADLKEFAAAITLYLDRFEDWRAYLADAERAAPEAVPAAAMARAAARELARALAGETWVEAGVPAALGAAEEALEGGGAADPVAARGLMASLGNVLAAIAARVLGAARAARRASGRFAADMASEIRRNIARRTVGLIGGALVAFLATQAPRLAALADALPAWFGWVGELLRFLGLV